MELIRLSKKRKLDSFRDCMANISSFTPEEKINFLEVFALEIEEMIKKECKTILEDRIFILPEEMYDVFYKRILCHIRRIWTPTKEIDCSVQRNLFLLLGGELILLKNGDEPYQRITNIPNCNWRLIFKCNDLEMGRFPVAILATLYVIHVISIMKSVKFINPPTEIMLQLSFPPKADDNEDYLQWLWRRECDMGLDKWRQVVWEAIKKREGLYSIKSHEKIIEVIQKMNLEKTEIPKLNSLVYAVAKLAIEYIRNIQK